MRPKQLKEIVRGFGHRNIKAIHPSTIMLTKDKHLSQTGDCIVTVAADKAITDLSPEFKDKLRKQNAKLTILIETEDLIEEIHASGSPKLVLSHPTDIVVRKSDYICNRTLAIHADKASKDLARAFVEKLKDREEIKITFTVES